MNCPFKMRTETKTEQWRRDTFWEKEPECLVWIKSFSPHDVFFDVGANVGVYSLFAASLYPEMTIIAFEPMPANYQALKENVALNGFNISCFQWAIGNRCGKAYLSVPDPEPGKSGAQMSREKSGVRVPIASIDAFMETDPLHVKIDIDGQEFEVVKGMRLTIPFIRSCLIEVSAATKGPVMEIFSKAGFTTDNRFNRVYPHSRERRAREGIDAENIVFTRQKGR